MSNPQALALTATLLAASNLLMTFAWYGHLRHLNASLWIVAALVGWIQRAGLCLVGAVYFVFKP